MTNSSNHIHANHPGLIEATQQIGDGLLDPTNLIEQSFNLANQVEPNLKAFVCRGALEDLKKKAQQKLKDLETISDKINYIFSKHGVRKASRLFHSFQNVAKYLNISVVGKSVYKILDKYPKKIHWVGLLGELQKNENPNAVILFKNFSRFSLPSIL